MPRAVLLGFTGNLPANAHADVKRLFCFSFKKHNAVINDCPTFVSADANWMLWRTQDDHAKLFWVVGKASNLGSYWGCMGVYDDATDPEQITATWKVWKEWAGGYPEARPQQGAPGPTVTDAPGVQLLFYIHSETDEVTVSGVRTREDRDTEGRKHAIDLNLFDAKRPRTVSCDLETRVTKARSVCTEAVDKRALELMQSTLEQYVKNKIDAATLEQRKAAARATAEAEHAPLSKLDKCYAAFTEAMSARVQAENAVESSIATEEAAKSELEAAVCALLLQDAGPSGALKGER